MNQLTARQIEVVDFISAFILENEYAPTIREIAKSFGISVNGVNGHLLRLRELGAVTWDERKARTLKVTPTEETKK